jgi:alkaline phosphatase
MQGMNPSTFRPPFRPALLAASIGVFLAGCAANGERAVPEAASPRAAAKNVILFIGDGMGVTTVTAARIFDGQSRGETGEENVLSFERFPRTALVKTYNTNQQVSDSAGTATAMHSGVKTRAGVIAVAPETHRRNCAEEKRWPLETIGELAKNRGKALGIVTTARITHATPATVYAHSSERDWESDAFLTDEQIAQGCGDIARQLLEFDVGGGFDIALGGGARAFYGGDFGGRRKARDENLVAEWESAGTNHRFVSTRDELGVIARGEQVLGIFSRSHMTYMAERGYDSEEPTLSEMTAAAIDHLDGPEGYYLMIEGGRIDHGHHDGKPGYALLETQEFAEAVSVALEKVDLDETLVLVTADHSHVFTLAGYPTRGNPILGLVVGNDTSGEPRNEPTLAADGQPYTSVGYANGPGAIVNRPRPTPETGIGAVAQSLVSPVGVAIEGYEYDDETHGGEDVPLYAIGNGSQCVAGVLEQNLVFDIMTGAFGWSADFCDKAPAGYR